MLNFLIITWRPQNIFKFVLLRTLYYPPCLIRFARRSNPQYVVIGSLLTVTFRWRFRCGLPNVARFMVWWGFSAQAQASGDQALSAPHRVAPSAVSGGSNFLQHLPASYSRSIRVHGRAYYQTYQSYYFQVIYRVAPSVIDRQLIIFLRPYSDLWFGTQSLHPATRPRVHYQSYFVQLPTPLQQNSVHTR